MFPRNPRTFAALAFLEVLSVALFAQTPLEPTAYTVTTQIQITGPAIRKTYRLGSKVLIDQGSPSGQKGAPPTHTRTLYDLRTMASLTWNPVDPSAHCIHGVIHGQEWQDPFDGASDLAMKDVKQTGTEKIHGVATVILESGKKPGFRLWVDPMTGLMWKADFTSKELGATMTYFEVLDVNLSPPPSSTFYVPSVCATPPTTPQPAK